MSLDELVFMDGNQDSLFVYHSIDMDDGSSKQSNLVDGTAIKRQSRSFCLRGELRN